MTGLADLEATIARLEAAAADAREATRELHSATKAARSAERDLDAAVKRCREEIPQLVDRHVTDAVKEQLDNWGNATQDAIKRAVGGVQRTFDEHMNMLLYGNAQGRGPSVLDEIGAALRHGRDQLVRDPTLPHLPTLER